MPARSEAEEITPTGVRFQDEYSFFLRNTPRLSCGRRLFYHRYIYSCFIKIYFGFVYHEHRFPPPSRVVKIIGGHVEPVLGGIVVYFIHLGRVHVAHPGGKGVLVELLFWHVDDRRILQVTIKIEDGWTD